jgi:predicted dehydrogenase
MNTPKLALVGCGYMGTEYFKVLQGLGVPGVEVVTRGPSPRKEEFEKKFSQKVSVATGAGLVAWAQEKRIQKAIVAVSETESPKVIQAMIDAGVKSILVEKPGALVRSELEKVLTASGQRGVSVSIAYNRRFHASTRAARKMIQEDGGVTSYSFEFTEWSDRIAKGNYPADVLRNWILANSSHVLDLAFYLGGAPKSLNALQSGALSWHPSGSRFAGSGVTQQGAVFSYLANWESGGRWGVEVMTQRRRYILRPLEGLQIQERNSAKVEPLELAEATIDQQYKPGLFELTKAFLSSESETGLLPLKEHLENWAWYEKINGKPFGWMGSN